MTALVARFLDKNKGEWLVKALIETIKDDTSIDDGQAFYIDDQGLLKNNFSCINRVSLPSFLLGIWHYIVMNVNDNTVGKDTFSNWHKKKGETNSEWVFNYEANVGNSITHKVAVFFPVVIDSLEPTNLQKDDASQPSEDLKQAYHCYLEFMKNKYKTIKTLLFENDPVPFYDFYVCNDILSRFGSFWTEEVASEIPHLKDKYQEALDKIEFNEKSLNEAKRCKASLSLLTRLYRFAIFTGIGGLGKSMLMRHLLLTAIDRFDELRLLPILVASQRPSDISDTIISQLHNYFIHRLVNEEDLRKMYRTVAFADKASNEMIPILPAGGCLVSGLAVNFPVLVQIDILPSTNRPKSENVNINKVWTK